MFKFQLFLINNQKLFPLAFHITISMPLFFVNSRNSKAVWVCYLNGSRLRSINI